MGIFNYPFYESFGILLIFVKFFHILFDKKQRRFIVNRLVKNSNLSTEHSLEIEFKCIIIFKWI